MPGFSRVPARARRAERKTADQLQAPSGKGGPARADDLIVAGLDALIAAVSVQTEILREILAELRRGRP